MFLNLNYAEIILELADLEENYYIVPLLLFLMAADTFKDGTLQMSLLKIWSFVQWLRK